jgi:hypothetical protein
MDEKAKKGAKGEEVQDSQEKDVEVVDAQVVDSDDAETTTDPDGNGKIEVKVNQILEELQSQREENDALKEKMEVMRQILRETAIRGGVLDEEGKVIKEAEPPPNPQASDGNGQGSSDRWAKIFEKAAPILEGVLTKMLAPDQPQFSPTNPESLPIGVFLKFWNLADDIRNELTDTRTNRLRADNQEALLADREAKAAQRQLHYRKMLEEQGILGPAKFPPPKDEEPPKKHLR